MSTAGGAGAAYYQVEEGMRPLCRRRLRPARRRRPIPEPAGTDERLQRLGQAGRRGDAPRRVGPDQGPEGAWLDDLEVDRRPALVSRKRGPQTVDQLVVHVVGVEPDLD